MGRDLTASQKAGHSQAIDARANGDNATGASSTRFNEGRDRFADLRLEQSELSAPWDNERIQGRCILESLMRFKNNARCCYERFVRQPDYDYFITLFRTPVPS